MTRGARKKKSTEASPAGSLVDGILKKYGVLQDIREHRLVTSWLEIVGDRVAARAWPDGLHEGVLYVRVANSAWLHELAFVREAIARQANQLVGRPPLVKEVRFHLGPARVPETQDDVVAYLSRKKTLRRPSPSRRAVPSAEALARIESETARVADPELRETIRALRQRLGL